MGWQASAYVNLYRPEMREVARCSRDDNNVSAITNDDMASETCRVAQRIDHGLADASDFHRR
jgi:hypothetical protein